MKKVIYIAYFVDTNSLVSEYGQIHTNLFAHHSTIEFMPKNVEGLDLGSTAALKITGRLTTDKVDVLLVDNPLSKNAYPHITLSTAEGVKPFDSNREIENNLSKIILLNDEIEGTLDCFYGN